MKKWNSENDVIVSKGIPKFSIDDYTYKNKPIDKFVHFNTQSGLYIIETKGKKVKEKKGPFVVTYTDIINVVYFDSGCGVQCVFDECRYVGGSKFLLFKSEKNIYILDRRGEMFLLAENVPDSRLQVTAEKEKGIYEVNGIKVRYLSDIQMSNRKNVDISDAVINEEYIKYISQITEKDSFWSYLDMSKRGRYIDYVIKNKFVDYEIVPNIFNDDSTVNVRIPLNSKNKENIYVQFLVAKYYPDFAVYNVPIEDIVSNLKCLDNIVISYSINEKQDVLSFAVIDAIKKRTGIEDSGILYCKFFKKLIEQIYNVRCEIEDNLFLENTMRRFPNSYQDVLDDFDNINFNLVKAGFKPFKYETILKKVQNNTPYYGTDANKCSNAITVSNKDFQKRINKFESDLLFEMKTAGYKVGKWVNEGNMFVLVKQSFPDAIYQYHETWLGHQSLDVYIPSLKIGLEYQGIQHYEPVEFFGGEEGFKKGQQLDIKKAVLCKQNGVGLIYWKYDEALLKEILLKKVSEVQRNM